MRLASRPAVGVVAIAAFVGRAIGRADFVRANPASPKAALAKNVLSILAIVVAIPWDVVTAEGLAVRSKRR
jgi:hypothetical protein